MVYDMSFPFKFNHLGIVIKKPRTECVAAHPLPPAQQFNVPFVCFYFSQPRKKLRQTNLFCLLNILKVIGHNKATIHI